MCVYCGRGLKLLLLPLSGLYLNALLRRHNVIFTIRYTHVLWVCIVTAYNILYIGVHTYARARAHVMCAHTRNTFLYSYSVSYIRTKYIYDARRRDWVCYRIPLMGGGLARLACVHVCEENPRRRRRRRTPRKTERKRREG